MKIAAPHIANLFSYGSLIGIPESFLRKSLMDPDLDVCTFENFVTGEEFLDVFRELLQQSGNPHFGWHYGSYLNLKALGLIAELSLSCSSIEQAILFLEKYLDETFPLVGIHTEKRETIYWITIHSPVKDDDFRHHLLDAVFCFMYRELRLMMKESFFFELQVPYAPSVMHFKSLNSGIKRGVIYAIGLDEQVLKERINTRRIKQIEYLLPKFMLMLTDNTVGYGKFSMQIKKMILNMCNPELPTFEQVAEQFPLSQRSIQRKLSKEGLSFRKIADDIKKELSFYLSKGNKLKTLEIAYLLGYSESSAYLHAVKRWKKCMKG